MDALASPDERRQRGRRSRVVLMPRRWHQVGDNASRIALAMVTKKPDHQEEREGNR
jgi:hypothetical protein